MYLWECLLGAVVMFAIRYSLNEQRMMSVLFSSNKGCVIIIQLPKLAQNGTHSCWNNFKLLRFVPVFTIFDDFMNCVFGSLDFTGQLILVLIYLSREPFKMSRKEKNYCRYFIYGRNENLPSTSTIIEFSLGCFLLFYILYNQLFAYLNRDLKNYFLFCASFILRNVSQS